MNALRDDPNDYPYDDLRTPLSSTRLPSSNPPTPTAFKTIFLLDGFSNSSDNFMYFQIQLPHRWFEGDAIEAHVHWTTNDAGSGGGAETVQWQLDYSWANIGDVFPAASSTTANVDIQDEPAEKHLLTELINKIPAKGKRASSIILCRIWRDVSEDNFAHPALLITVDFHYRSDSDGSYHPYYKLSSEKRKLKGTPKDPFLPGAW